MDFGNIAALASISTQDTGQWLSGAMDRLRGALGLRPSQPAAMTRITHTPVYVQPQPGLNAQYQNGAITISPDKWYELPHESAHAIYDAANLKSQAAQLARQVSPYNRERILNSSTYANMPAPYAGSPEQISDEGLGFSIGDRDETGYVEKAASAIQDPGLAARLRRLNINALNSKRDE